MKKIKKPIPKKDIEYLEMVRPYQGKWVALNKEKMEILVASKDLNKLKDKIREETADIVFRRILPQDIAYVT